MRIGTTSYIYPADILPNVKQLTDQIDDIELVLFEVDDQNNLPNSQTINELIRIAAAHDLTYTVHLPLDLKLANDDNTSSIEKALKVISQLPMTLAQFFLGFPSVGDITHSFNHSHRKTFFIPQERIVHQ